MKPRFKPTEFFRQCVGIDVSRDTFTACLSMLDDEGCSTPPVDFSNDKHGFNQLIRWTRKEMLPHHPLCFVMEPTGVYHEALALHLHKIGFIVHLVSGSRARQYAKFEGYTTKTDCIDAYVLSILGCDKRRLKPWTPPAQHIVELRTLTRFRSALVKQQTMLKNQYEALSHSGFCSNLPVRLCKTALSDINRNIERVEAEIESQYEKSEDLKKMLGYATSIPGIGRCSAITILTETGCFSNFQSYKQVVSFAGLDVVARQSGNHDPKRRISKNGNVPIRRVLYTCAMASIQCNDKLKEFYLRIKKSNPTGKVALTAVMRKLLILVYIMCKNQTMYNPNYEVNNE